MKWSVGSAAAALAAAISAIAAQQPPADLIVSNGKIITVDERFTIAQAVAVRGDRIVRVGSNADVTPLAGPATRRIDLGGNAVVPGLIDNHMHLLRAGTTWQFEVRLDGVGSRAQALELLRARAKTTPAGEWIYTLGGWTIDQFADDSRPLLRDELDRVSPDHPVFLQASYYNGFLNSRALQALGISETSPGPGWIVRDGFGRPTGVIEEAGIRTLAARLPAASAPSLETSTLAMMRDLNAAGLTAFGSAGCETDVLPLYRRWAAEGRLDVRVYCITGGPPLVTDPRAIPRTGRAARDPFIDHIAYGESVWGPLHDPMFLRSSSPQPADLVRWREIATGIAKARIPLHVHANLTNTIDAFLDQIELIDGAHPVSDLRWTLAHVNQLNAAQLARMKKLNVQAAVHPWAVINGGINRRVFGDAALDMPPLRTIQDSGVLWGLGSDGSRANQILPFTTLWWAVTGKMVGGANVLRQTITREQALIAHTRSNAYFVFQEDNLGSIEPGKLADLVVLDRDYLTVPEDEIKGIRAVVTIVGGRVVYEP